MVSVVLIGYCYLLFPAILLVLARLFPKPVRKGNLKPHLSILIPAHNEAEIIGRKIENTLSLNYPSERMEIIVISDGSTDDTARITKDYEGKGVKLISFAERHGKVPSLLSALQQARGEIIVFSDASGMLHPDALMEAVSNFADETVGCVSGYYKSPGLLKSGRRGELLYWDYESAIRRAESRWATLLGATGAMYALRRDIFVAPRQDTINDDFVIPALLVLKGFRAVLEEKAVVNDLDPGMGDLMSRMRVAAGNWQQLFFLKGLLSPFRPKLCWLYWSHKFLRMLVPLLLVIIFICLILSFPITVTCVAVILLIGALLRGEGRGGLIFAAWRKFLAGNIAGLYGMLIYIFKRGRLRWR